ncbi:uroporphyrinogen-III synthase [Paramicrobacterium fandaimingii]|uniref:uroporphyrinogen-III synthase n=1 Tax=Paramicrobacterium fandaimingii TaxID=2708079 RepID=UPI00141F4988|nr:uroporphyrinogen-III synthase [Microbacterium fandaimingii]
MIASVAEQLPGIRIGVTSDRRGTEIVDALQRRGARVFHAPTLRAVPAENEELVISETRKIIAAHPEAVLVTTSYGIRRWFDIAEAAGLGPELNRTFERARIFVRGSKARGAVRALGFDDAGSGDRATLDALVNTVRHKIPHARNVAVQLYGPPQPEALTRFADGETRLHTVTPYHVMPTADERVTRLIDMTIARSIDIVTFTSAPSVDALFARAAAHDRDKALVEALRESVTTAVVGPVTAEPLRDRGIRPLVPSRHRLGALVRLICEHIADGSRTSIDTQHGVITMHGNSVNVSGRIVQLTPTVAGVLRALIEADGAVLTRGELASYLPHSGGSHAIEVLVSRLRSALGSPALVRTVVKRGYRIDV